MILQDVGKEDIFDTTQKTLKFKPRICVWQIDRVLTYIYSQNQPNVGIYTSRMDAMGMEHLNYS